MDIKAPRHVTALRSWIDRVIALRSQMNHVIALRQISVTALFYLEDRKIHLRGVRAHWSKNAEKSAPAHGRERERASELALALPFTCLPLPGPVLCKLGQPGVLFVLPEVLTQVLGVGDGQGGLACCDSWGRKESDTTERLIWSDLMIPLCLVFQGNSMLFSIVAPPFTSHQDCGRILFSVHSLQ